MRDVSKSFSTPQGGNHDVLRDINFSVAPGEFTAVVGPTGCGKSTTLSMICGTDQPDSGEVLIGGRPVDGIGDQVGFVFQADAVFPWKTVIGNIATGPRFRGMPRKEALAEAADWVRRVGLAGFERYHPHQLSGGMRKRVALAQTMINRPRVLLMDEPFAGLDVQTRQIMSDELLSLWELTRPSVVFITHDLEEAISLADRVVVMTAGPATVKQEFRIDLPRPRNTREIRHTPEFVKLHERIWEALRDEVQVAYRRSVTAA
ncbi:ABC transporter ATP-binding protein [Streptomyces sp. SL13]|jgi:NitT/TauT family transport system ATP-binding protein|uniref:ABC transporter ATP-binding protein n=1 Tax=Streptantibioticus silvisoli TaxID=2705255 RepID=A0AA90K8J9_9ACTN|nr:ABC transporter ATP-binding protein [Streptantibioticus silvisoli]MDI5963697.1 ABC transporter ATP-binding protein [Streptantibioticus silvisoli]MDI5969537.1 ABC transporter ATP-binding protein [Streptantibioticus silvisoli]